MLLTKHHRDSFTRGLLRTLLTSPTNFDVEQQPISDKEFYVGIGLTLLAMIFVSFAFGTFPI